MEHEPDDDSPLLHSTRLPAAPAAPRPAGGDRSSGEDLREALDQLRAELDGDRRPRPAPEPAPVAAPATSGGRRRSGQVALVALAAVAALAACAGIVRVVAWSTSGPVPPSAAAPRVPSPPAGAPQPSASAGPTAATTPSGTTPSGTTPSGTTPSGTTSSGTTSSATTPAPPSGPAVALPAGLPTSGPGADAPGAELVAALAPGGVVDVHERLVVRPGTSTVVLAAAGLDALPRSFGTARPTVTALEVAVDGRAATATAEGAGWRVTAAAPFTQLVVHYRLTGALVAASPAPPGRRTLVLRPVSGPVAAAAGDPVLVRLDDARVGAVYCPAAPSPLCAVSAGAVHVATVPAGTPPLVLAQVTLR